MMGASLSVGGELQRRKGSSAHLWLPGVRSQSLGRGSIDRAREVEGWKGTG